MKIRCWRSYSDCDYVRGIWHSEDRASWYILIIKAKRCTISRLYFGKQIYMFRTDLLSIIRSLFYVLLTVLLDTILFNDQLDAQFFFVYVYFNSLHVSSIKCSSSGDSIVSLRYLVYITQCWWPSGMQVWTERPNLHTRQSPTLSDIYQIS